MRTRLALAAALLMLAAGCAAPAGSNGPATIPSATESATIAINLMDFMIDPSDIEVAGPTATIEVTSEGPTPHNLTIRDASDEVVAGTADLSTGDTETITAELEPGEYTIFCALAGHESLGMSGTLTVTAP
ncbi:MAG: cupredoxin domain-containing protein [Candidatus Limnocylindria bacterium]